VATSVPGNVWKIEVAVGDEVQAGDLLLVVESMKMEFSVLAPSAGTVHQLYCREGAPVAAGQDVVVILEKMHKGQAT
jgi:urea carboxylase